MVHATIPFVLFASLDAHNSSFLKETGDITLKAFQNNTNEKKAKGTLACSATEHDEKSCKANDDCVWKLLGPERWACEYGNVQQQPRRSECLHEQPTGGASAKLATGMASVSSFLGYENPIGKHFPKNATCQKNAADYCPDVVSGWRNKPTALLNFASKEAMEKCCFKTCLNTHKKRKLLIAQANGSIGVDLYTVLQEPTAVCGDKAITDPQTCHAAAIVTDYSFYGEEDTGNELPGCYVKPHGAVFYNKNPNGKAGYGSKSTPICFSTTSQ